MTDLMSRLKRETADCHQALEQALDLGRPAMDHADYVALLAGFRGFVAPWEQAIAAAVPARLLAFVQEREKTPLLDADLTFLSESRLVPGMLPNCDALPRLSLLGDIFGSMYVLEGSTLGGRFIGPAMAKRFDLSERRGYAYFDPYQAHTGSMWNAFKALAVAEVAEDEYDAAVHAACETFGALHTWLRPGTLGRPERPERPRAASPTSLARTTPSGVSVS